MFVVDVHALGLKPAQGLMLTESFYWDLNDRTRAFTERFAARTRAAGPTMVPAGCLRRRVPHYLKAVRRASRRRRPTAPTWSQRMKAMPTDDDAFGTGTHPRRTAADPPRLPVRGEDAGRDASRGTTTSCVATIPGDEAFRPLAEGGCPLVKCAIGVRRPRLDALDASRAASSCAWWRPSPGRRHGAPWASDDSRDRSMFELFGIRRSRCCSGSCCSA